MPRSRSVFAVSDRQARLGFLVEIEGKGTNHAKYKKLLAYSLFVLAVLILFTAATAKDKLGPYNLIDTILVPGNLANGFDISWVDSASQRYYLSDRGAASIDVIDAEHDQYLYSIPGFVGVSAGGRGKSGPDGVLTIPKENELWAGDGDSTVKVVDLSAGGETVQFVAIGNTICDTRDNFSRRPGRLPTRVLGDFIL